MNVSTPSDLLALPCPLRGTLLVRDCLGAEAGFLIVQLVKAALNGEPAGSMSGVLPSASTPPAAATPAARRVVLLAAAQAASHYAAVLRKAGMNLQALVGAGRLTLVELLPELAAPAGPPSLKAVHTWLAGALAGSPGDGPTSDGGSSGSRGDGVCLVVDDLTALHCLASDPADWAAFLQACAAVGQAPGCAFVGLAHADVEDDHGWLARLEHAAAVVLDVEPLESGRSTDLTGRLALTVRDAAPRSIEAAAPAAAAPGRHAPGTRHYCYRLAEAGVRYVEQMA